MKRVGVREFRDHATQYLAGDDVLLVERHGQPVGLYIPTKSNPHHDRVAAVQRLEQTVERILRETELSEDDLAGLFDLSKPLPDELHASGR
jgi:antitoxin (DNA-binding transcriptional repressor) of toxin-antitoxin stability system